MATLHRPPRAHSHRHHPSAVAAPGQASVVAGVSLALMAVLGGWANFGALAPLLAADDAARTATNIAAAEPLFRAGIAAMIVVALLDIIVAIALLVVFEPVNRGLAVTAAALRVAYAAGLAVAASQLVTVPALLDEPTEAMRAIEVYDATWQVSLILFAAHLILIGHLGFRSGFMPRIFGVLLVIAGLGYLADGFGTVLIPGFSPTFALFTFVGEVALIFWLLISGRRLADRPSAGASDVV